MSKRSEVILSVDDEQQIADALSEMSDPDQRASFEADFRKKLISRAVRSEEKRLVKNEAYRRAVRLGLDDPSGYAERATSIAFMQKIMDWKAAKLKASPQVHLKSAANRAAEHVEQTSRTANPGMRRILQADRKYLEVTGIADRDGQLMSSGLVGVQIKKALPGYKLPHWEKTTLPLKVMALSLEIGKRGGRTINLRISDDASAKALMSSRGPVSFVQNQVRETLKRRFEADAPEFWFVMEKDPVKGFHLHGAYEHAPYFDHLLIDEALRDAGGWGNAHGRGLSQVSRLMKDPIWWAYYTVKQLNLTRMMTDRKLLGSTAEIRSAARGSWEAVRARMPRG